jgi:hypothetical protein
MILLYPVEESRASFIRWHDIAINQLGFANNLILTFAGASLGFILTVLGDAAFTTALAAKPEYRGREALLASALLMLASIGLGIWCVINRLKDFRETAGIALDRERMEQQGLEKCSIDAKLERRREANRKRGKVSLRLFYWQIGTFGVAIALLVLSFVVVHGPKLYPSISAPAKAN